MSNLQNEVLVPVTPEVIQAEKDAGIRCIYCGYKECVAVVYGESVCGPIYD